MSKGVSGKTRTAGWERLSPQEPTCLLQHSSGITSGSVPQASPALAQAQGFQQKPSILPCPWQAHLVAAFSVGNGIGFCAFPHQASQALGNWPPPSLLLLPCSGRWALTCLARVSHRGLHVSPGLAAPCLEPRREQGHGRKSLLSLHQSFDSGVQSHSHTAAVQTPASFLEVRTFS